MKLEILLTFEIPPMPSPKCQKSWKGKNALIFLCAPHGFLHFILDKERYYILAFLPCVRLFFSHMLIFSCLPPTNDSLVFGSQCQSIIWSLTLLLFTIVEKAKASSLYIFLQPQPNILFDPQFKYKWQQYKSNTALSLNIKSENKFMCIISLNKINK